MDCRKIQTAHLPSINPTNITQALTLFETLDRFENAELRTSIGVSLILESQDIENEVKILEDIYEETKAETEMVFHSDQALCIADIWNSQNLNDRMLRQRVKTYANELRNVTSS